MKMPNKLILAVIKQPNSYNSWWYEVFSVDIFERTDNGFAGSLKNAEKDLSELHHGTEVRAFELVKENEYVHEGMSGCDCETYSLRGIYQVKGSDPIEVVELELHEDMDGNIGYDVVYELNDYPTLAGEDEFFDFNSI